MSTSDQTNQKESDAPAIQLDLLRREFMRDQRKRQLVSHILVAPLLIFILTIFIGPIFAMLSRGVDNPELQKGLPNVSQSILEWNEEVLPQDSIFVALAKDLTNDELKTSRAAAARRLNYEIPGYRTLIMRTARKLVPLELSEEPSILREQFLKLDKRWGQKEYWHAMKRAAGSYTSYYLLASLDLKVNDENQIVRAAPEQQIFITILLRSMWVSVVVTVTCLLIAFPVANYMVTASPMMQALTSLSILLPFWTSLLVRTSAWIVVLQREGLVNDMLMGMGLVSEPVEMIFNRVGVYIAMIHILLPFMVLPLYSVMKGISPTYMRAAASLGATPFRAFRTVYLPLTMPGVGAGCLLTFILAVGYYITPALVGGAGDQMIGYFIAFFTNTRLNWGMASALSFILLMCILALYVGLGRYIGISRLVGLEK